MATVKIRGRAEALEIDDSRAQTLKNRKFGFNGVAKAEPLDLVDLGEWAGEYGRIVEITIPKQVKEKSQSEINAEQNRKEEEAWLKLQPEVRAKMLSRFTLLYASRIGDLHLKDLPPDVAAKAEAIQLKYYTENPTEMQVPIAEFADVLPQKTEKSASLGQITASMKMSNDAASMSNGRTCLKCGKELTGNLKEYCSGTCMLAGRNGEVSTESI